MTSYGASELAAAFRTVRKNTVQLAEEVPEDKYNFVPAPGTRSVGALLAHIAVAPALHEDMHRVQHVATLKGYDFAKFMALATAQEQKPRSKAEIVALLKADGERYAAWLESLTPAFLAETFTDPTGQNPRTRFESLLGTKEHEMHHRGQLMLVQRMLGQVPHLTRQMQERMEARAVVAQAVTAGARG